MINPFNLIYKSYKEIRHIFQPSYPLGKRRTTKKEVSSRRITKKRRPQGMHSSITTTHLVQKETMPEQRAQSKKRTIRGSARSRALKKGKEGRSHPQSEALH